MSSIQPSPCHAGDQLPGGLGHPTCGRLGDLPPRRRYAVAPDSLAEIADSGNSRDAVIGTPLLDWRRRDLMRTTVELRVGGGAPVPNYRGSWRRAPPDVFAWLVNSLSRRGIALPAGAVILTGSLTEPRPVAPGSSAVARFEGGAEVRMSIAKWA